MPGRWGPDGPPADAYERLTNLERFDPLARVADDVVAELLAAYDARAEPATLRGKPGVRVVPAAGAPLTLVVDLPCVLVWSGLWTGGGAFPPCACDACDEDAASAEALLRDWVTEVTERGLTEELTVDPPRLAHAVDGASGWSLLSPAELARLAALAPPGLRRWPPWPRR